MTVKIRRLSKPISTLNNPAAKYEPIKHGITEKFNTTTGGKGWDW
jgi:hypothetical protein